MFPKKLCGQTPKRTLCWHFLSVPGRWCTSLIWTFHFFPRRSFVAMFANWFFPPLPGRDFNFLLLIMPKKKKAKWRFDFQDNGSLIRNAATPLCKSGRWNKGTCLLRFSHDNFSVLLSAVWRPADEGDELPNNFGVPQMGIINRRPQKRWTLLSQGLSERFSVRAWVGD